MPASEQRLNHAVSLDDRTPQVRTRLALDVAVPRDHHLEVALLDAHWFGIARLEAGAEVLQPSRKFRIRSHPHDARVGVPLPIARQQVRHIAGVPPSLSSRPPAGIPSPPARLGAALFPAPYRTRPAHDIAVRRPVPQDHDRDQVHTRPLPERLLALAEQIV